MPSGLHRRDSMGKCDQGQDIYSVVRNPKAHGPSKSHEIKAIKTDHLETGAERLHRQQMEAMKQGYLRIMGEDGSAIKLIAVTAKYAFMIAVFPPYMLFYVIPEFIFVKMIPKLVKESLKMIERLPNWFSPTTTWLPNPNQILSQLIKPFAVAKHHLEDFLKMMKHSTQTARQAIVEVFKKGIELAKLPFIRIAQVFKDIGLGLKTAAETVAKNAVKINDKVEQVIQTAKEQIVAMVLPIVQPLVQWVEAKYSYTTDVAKKGIEIVTNTAYKAVEKIKEQLMPPVEKTVKIAKEATKWVSNKIYMVAQPVIVWAKPKLEKAKELAKRAVKEVEKIREKAQQVVETMKQNTMAFVAPIVVQGQNLINLMVTAPIVRLYKKAQDGKSFKDRAKHFGEGFKRAITYVQSGLSKKTKQAVSYLGELVFKALQSLKTFLLTLPRKIWHGMIVCGKASIRFAKASGTFLVKTYHFSGLLLKFGMQLIRELKSDISLYISHARSKET